jgi:hypothetical protein
MKSVLEEFSQSAAGNVRWGSLQVLPDAKNVGISGVWVAPKAKFILSIPREGVRFTGLAEVVAR